ncbi:MAG: inositol monophosphatase family protein [Actinomycetota bacterium]
MTTDHTKLLQIAHEVTDEAKEIFLQEPPGDYTPKGDRDFATEVDFAIERTVRERLAKLTPDIGFVGEEYGGDQDAERYWCLDPIDGTINYAASSPLCAISLALIEDGQPTIGIIDAPRLGDRYSASLGAGSTRNHQPIASAEAKNLNEAISSFGDFSVAQGYEDRYRQQREILDAAAKKFRRVRMLGTAALDLAWLADGKHAAAIIIGGQLWDIAAGQVIAQEAGAIILRTPFNNDTTTIGCARGVLGQVTELADEHLRERFPGTV